MNNVSAAESVYSAILGCRCFQCSALLCMHAYLCPEMCLHAPFPMLSGAGLVLAFAGKLLREP